MAENLILITWNEPSKAYQALSDLRNGSWNFNLRNAVVVERQREGQFVVKDGAANTIGLGTLSGSLIGMAVGILGGPIGMLLGWSSGALFGSLVDMNKAVDDGSALAAMSHFLPPGSTALMLDVDEQSDAAIDAFADNSGGMVLRKSADLVRAEVSAAEEAADAASKEASRVLRQNRRNEAKDKIEQTWDSLKSKFKHAFD